MTQRAIDGLFVYFLTTNVTYGHWWLNDITVATLLARHIENSCRELGFQLFCYAILPNHIHILIQKYGKYSVSRLMRDIKGRFSKQMRPGRFWKPRFNFRIIDNVNRFNRTVEYVQFNFRKMGLPETYGKSPYTKIFWKEIDEYFSEQS